MKHFVDEVIQVELLDGTFLERKPKCPTRILWQGMWIGVASLESAWDDLSRRGNKARNMREGHLERAKVKGSWGVGKFYFRFLGEDHQTYTIYYDRTPDDAENRKGTWVLLTVEGQ